MATPVKTKQGTWRIIIEVAGERKSKTLPTEEAAARWASLEVARMKKQRAIAADTINLALGTSLPTRVLDALATIKYTHQDIADAAKPIGDNCGIYFLLKNAVVVYVGKSTEVIYRIGRHCRERVKEFDSFTYMLCDEADLDRMEETYITALVPLYNMRMGGHVRDRSVHPYDKEKSLSKPPKWSTA